MRTGKVKSLIQDGDLRLRAASMQDADGALKWYSDPEVLKYSEGTLEPYSREKVEKMYRYLSESGHFFIIEVKNLLKRGRFCLNRIFSA